MVEVVPDVHAAVPAFPGRRAVLLRLGGVLLSAALTACTAGSGTTPPTTTGPRPPTPDEVAREAAATDSRALLAQALAVTGSGRVAGVLDAAVGDHRIHLQALGAPEQAAATSPGGPAASPGATTAPATSSSPAATAAAGPPTAGATASAPTPATATTAVAPASPADQVAMEAAAAGRAVEAASGDGVTPGMATLLARIAACRAVHADLLAVAAGVDLPPATGLDVAPPSASAEGSTPPTGTPSAPGPTGSPPPPPPELAPAAAMLGGEHAAVFAYGLVTARAGQARARALALLTEHVARRDAIEGFLLARGTVPPAAAPAYEVGPVPKGAAQAAALAQRVEDGTAAVAAAAVAAEDPAVRGLAATLLVAAARRAAAWRGATEPLPGGAVPAAVASPTTSAGPGLPLLTPTP